jgi:hypothetical protein
MYKPNIQVRSRNYFCRGKTISITYSECVSVALISQHAKGKRHIILAFVTCRFCHIFHIISQMARLSEISY